VLSCVQNYMMSCLKVVLAILAFGPAVAFAQGVTVDVSRIGDASHFEFSGVKDWKYEVKKSETGPDNVVLSIRGLKTEAVSRLRTHADSIVQKVTVNEQGVDEAVELTFSLAKGADYFDYLTEEPSRLIVDFFPKEESDKPAPAAEPKKFPLKATKQTAKNSGLGTEADISATITGIPNAKAKRSPAGADFPMVAKNEGPSLAEEISSRKDFSHGIFDGGDPQFQRFSIKDYEVKEESIIASRANYYLPFPMLDLGQPQLDSLIKAQPTYEIVPNETRENQDARVILSLFTSGKRGLLVKTANEFLLKYPISSYDEIVRYMLADTHYAYFHEKGSNYDFDLAMNQYDLLTEKYPKSPITPRTLLLIAYSFMDRGDSFGALKAFQRFSRANENSKHIDQVNIATAEAYLRINKYSDSIAALEQIEKNGHSQKIKHDAAFRKGGVYFRKKDWAESIKEYQAAIKKYGDVASQYPNVYYNMAEAEFRRGKYREALEAYRVFLQKFPDHEHGGYAMTRLGELLDILGADAKRGQGAYLESSFRYRGTPGAGVARIRFLVSRMADMKDKELASALEEIESIKKHYSEAPPTAEEVAAEKAALDEAKKKEELAAKEPKKEGGEHAAPAAGEHEGKAEGKGEVAAEPEPVEPETVAGIGEAFKRRPVLPGIEEFVTMLVADGLTARKQFDQASNDLIAYYQRNPQSANKDRIKHRIVKNIVEGIRQATDKGDFIDSLRRWSKNQSGWLKNTDRVDVRFAVGRAYEQAGVLKEAASIYSDCIKRLSDLRASGEEKEHGVFETLPKSDQLNLRLATVAARDKAFAQAESYLKNIPTNSLLTEPEQIERAEISADVAEARGQTEAAKKYLTELIKAWKGKPELTSPLHLRLAKLQMQSKNFTEADNHLSKIGAMKASGAPVSDDVHAKALELRGDLLVARGKRSDAAKAYKTLLDQYEATRPLASVRYRLGRLLFEDGDLKEAESAWNGLSPEKDGLWARLASEQMQGAKWQREYKKYLNRIPAAADMR
jgi:tetratricopeptide (TPR) repeat protein